MFLGTQKCVTEGFLRGLWCQSTHTHICVQRAVCVCQHLPKSALPNSHDANVLHPLHVVSHLSRMGCNIWEHAIDILSKLSPLTLMGKASENGSNTKTWMIWNNFSNGMKNIWQLENFLHLILRIHGIKVTQNS